MTLPTDLHRLSLRSPDALLAAIPYLLGFHPRESAVIVWLERGRILLTQRIDLPGDGTDLAAWSRAVWGHRAASAAQELVLIVVSAHDVDPAVVGAATAPATAARIHVRDVLRMHAGRWWSLICDSAECCPPEGRVLDRTTSDAVGAEFTVMGRAPLEARADLERQVHPDPERTRAVDAEIEARTRRGAPANPGARERWRDRLIARIDERLSGEDALAAGDVADIAVGLRDIRVRDTVLWSLASWDEPTLAVALDRLLEAVRATPPAMVAPVATCGSVVAWLAGDGARAWVALDRALAAEPEYSLAQLLSASLGAGLPPATWREAMAAVGREQCRHGAVGERMTG